MSTTYVAFLRGINVGGKNKLPMRDLRDLFTEAGCEDVRTYIQSGNVIFRAEPGVITSLPDTVTAQIAKRYGHRTPIVVRTAARMDDMIRQNPFIAQGADEDELHVLFLAGKPDAQRIAALDPDRSPPDAFVVRGEEIYLRLPNGMGRTKLTNDYIDRTLATTSTARNWRTVMKLRAMMDD
jgi:uncharacterized protein (DUF1697 family)